MSDETPDYYVLDSSCPTRMQLWDADPVGPGAGQEWIEGRPFEAEPEDLPVVVTIVEGDEQKTRLDYFGDPIASERFYDALVAGGVDNLEAYDCILESVDGSLRLEGYKALNFIGVVSMASSDTEFASASEIIDAHIAKMAPDTSAAGGMQLFRLAEAIQTVVVSERLKTHLESYEFPYLVFRKLTELVT